MSKNIINNLTQKEISQVFAGNGANNKPSESETDDFSKYLSLPEQYKRGYEMTRGSLPRIDREELSKILEKYQQPLNSTNSTNS
jgi:hypothetical protein